jgi:alkanesulfonate monooxygenase SsuD/methylene tetrahydromethanopterin reductase-like flavin-dependent oxidoreductase (luciferase family)
MVVIATEHIGLGTAVFNSVTCKAVLTVASSNNRFANGYMVLGIGRGNFALANSGCASSQVAKFKAYLHYLQAYLPGEAILNIPNDVAPPVQGLGLV